MNFLYFQKNLVVRHNIDNASFECTAKGHCRGQISISLGLKRPVTGPTSILQFAFGAMAEVKSVTQFVISHLLLDNLRKRQLRARI